MEQPEVKEHDTGVNMLVQWVLGAFLFIIAIGVIMLLADAALSLGH